MKNISVLLMLLMGLLVAGGCKKKKEEVPQEIIPKVLDFQGPTDVVASGIEELEYSVAYRTGSTWEFTAVGWPATITVPDTAFSNRVHVVWQQSDQDTAAWLVCVETSATGNVSDPDSLQVTLHGYCPILIGDFEGNWQGYSTGDSEDTLAVTITQGPGTDVLRVLHLPDSLDGGGQYLPPFMQSVFKVWGERFVAGKGNEGDVLLHMDLASGKLYIENDFWGQTLPGPYNYWTGGDGTWSGCDTTMVIHFNLYWSTNYSKPNMTSTINLHKE